MSRWAAHKDTFVCDDHPRLTARARRYQAIEGTGPRCPTCSQPMKLANLADRRMVEVAIQVERIRTP